MLIHDLGVLSEQDDHSEGSVDSKSSDSESTKSSEKEGLPKV